MSVSLLNPPGTSCIQLVLTDSEDDKIKWIGMLQELQRLLKKTMTEDMKVCNQVILAGTLTGVQRDIRFKVLAAFSDSKIT